ncbi:hypothetical protein ACFMPD_05100 [Sedimentitalea sp. HM32M-2]|uniref:hypothetical protein n=1 Tax=Sedimentitalea sp. HM32M-2 TaxID=3351566 RepID=UPI0036292CC0
MSFIRRLAATTARQARIVPVPSGLLVALVALFWLTAQMVLADISRFVGDYSGQAELVNADGSVSPRDLSVSIRETRRGFSVRWTTTTHKPGGRTKEVTYDITFVPSDRPGVFAAAMKKNVFGHAVQMDPMKGEPYVWARITGEMLTVFSLFVDSEGGYELQQFDRSLVRGGLQLEFQRITNGVKQRSTKAYLDKRE